MVRLELPVYQKIVHRAAVRVAHHAVEDLTGLEAADLVGEDPVYELLCLRAFHKDLSHMGNVEHAHLLPHCQVLLDDVAVLDWHLITCKRAYLGAKGHVLAVEAGSFKICRNDFAHKFQ